MRGNSFSNGNSSYNGNGPGVGSPAAINPWTGTRLQPYHWWYWV